MILSMHLQNWKALFFPLKKQYHKPAKVGFVGLLASSSSSSSSSSPLLSLSHTSTSEISHPPAHT